MNRIRQPAYYLKCWTLNRNVYNIALDLQKNDQKGLKKKYNISSDKFAAELSAEDLKGKDMEYVEWAGEYQLALRLNERLMALKSIENVT